MTVQQLFASMHAVSVPHDMHVVLTKEHLLAEIDTASQAVAEYLAANPNYFLGTVFPRGKARFSWLAREVQMWRLDLKHPLWLGVDGVIYRGYDIDRWEDGEFPYYLLRAEIERRGVHGLERVLTAVRSLMDPEAPAK